MSRRAAVMSAVLLSCASLTGCPFFGMATVGGTLSGLNSGASVTLQNNGRDDLTLTQNGRFTFSRTLDADDDYRVTVLVDPVGQDCTVANATGTINSDTDDIDNVEVSCAATGTLVGTVTGLPQGTFVTLVNNNANPIQVFADGNFAFPGILSNGTTYAVTVSTQPAGGVTCTVAGGSGEIQQNAPSSTIAVTCT